jgi:hypothetical protein
MSTAIDFYLGRGTAAKWLGSLRRTGAHRLRLADRLTTRCPDTFEANVTTLLDDARLDGSGEPHLGADGWPWVWSTSHATDLVYAFDHGQLWVSERGRGWQSARLEPCFPRDEFSCPVHPTMRATGPTLARSYGPRFTSTAHLGLAQLADRISAELAARRAFPFVELPARLRYRVTVDEATSALALEVHGLTEGDTGADRVLAVLRSLPAEYGWTGESGDQPRFAVTVVVRTAAALS